MNTYIKSQIRNMLTVADTFQHSCTLAAKRDDGAISKEEAKILKEIDVATSKFKSKLEHVLEHNL